MCYAVSVQEHDKDPDKCWGVWRKQWSMPWWHLSSAACHLGRYKRVAARHCSPSHCRARHGRTGLSRLLHHKYTAPIIANLKGAGPGCLQGAATQEDPHSDLIHFAGSALASHTPLHASFLRDDTALAQYSAHRLAWNPFGFESCKLT
eukprot:scaffold122837_cov18-Tisochrysis_lutea.AAC.3